MNLYLYRGFDHYEISDSLRTCTHAVVHEDVETIHRGAFSDCHYLVSVVMFDSVRRIEDYAFDSCVNLKTIKFSRNLNYIGNHVFAKCYSIECYSIPPTVARIGTDAFADNEELRYINVPQFQWHIQNYPPDLRTTSVYTVTAKEEGVTNKAAVTGELHNHAVELFVGEVIQIARLM